MLKALLNAVPKAITKALPKAAQKAIAKAMAEAMQKAIADLELYIASQSKGNSRSLITYCLTKQRQ